MDTTFLNHLARKIWADMAYLKTLFLKEEDAITSSRIYKDEKTGDWRFLGVYSNNFIDRDKDIISEAAHKEYVEWLERTGFQPVVTVLHQPKAPFAFWEKLFDAYGDNGEVLNKVVEQIYEKTAFARVDKVISVNGFSLVSAKVIPGKEEIAEKLSHYPSSGMSHGFLGFTVQDLDDSIKTNEGRTVIDHYRSFEMSFLPDRGRAANVGTFGMIIHPKGRKSMLETQKALSAEDRAYLIETYGEDVATVLDKGTEELAKLLSAVGLDFKDFQKEEDMSKKDVVAVPDEDEEEDTPEVETEEANKPEVGQSTDPVSVVFAALNVEELQGVIAEQSVALEAMGKTVAALEARVKAIEPIAAQIKTLGKSEDERIAEQISPKVINWRKGVSVTQSEDNLVKEGEGNGSRPSAPQQKARVNMDNPLEALIFGAIGGNTN